MLKIVGGKHRGRTIAAPEGEKTRPTAARAREALFNILVHANWAGDGTSPLVDCRVLDAFAGSGALGLEALSRGAAHASFLDSDPTAIKLIGENLRKLGETAAAKVISAVSAVRPSGLRRNTVGPGSRASSDASARPIAAAWARPRGVRSEFRLPCMRRSRFQAVSPWRSM